MKALIHLFPQIPFDPARFSLLPGMTCSFSFSVSFSFPLFFCVSSHFLLPANHLSRDYKRTFFEKFATKAGFDPLVPQRWYYVSEAQVAENKVRRNIFLSFLYFIYQINYVSFCYLSFAN